MTSGRKHIDPLNIGPLGGPLGRENEDPMANMMISPFFMSAAIILAKKAIAGLLNSATVAEFS